MKSYIILALSLLFPVSSFAQSTTYKVTVIDNNLFETGTDYEFRMANLFVPSVNETNPEVKALADEIFKWANEFTADAIFRIVFVDGKKFLNLIKVEDEEIDAAYQYLINGYAIYTGNEEWEGSRKYFEAQEEAISAKRGIWSLSEENIAFMKSRADIFRVKTPKDNAGIRTNRPNLPLLGVALATAILAWDSFATASDINENIDAIRKFNRTGELESLKSLESQSTRKLLVGVASVIATIAVTYFALERVEIKSDYNSLTVSYRF